MNWAISCSKSNWNKTKTMPNETYEGHINLQSHTGPFATSGGIQWSRTRERKKINNRKNISIIMIICDLFYWKAKMTNLCTIFHEEWNEWSIEKKINIGRHTEFTHKSDFKSITFNVHRRFFRCKSSMAINIERYCECAIQSTDDDRLSQSTPLQILMGLYWRRTEQN